MMDAFVARARSKLGRRPYRGPTARRTQTPKTVT
jgi:hypothetical protein